ncbi:hypothetical protein CB0940_00182 [Cercospora beticola]|nr:hypothetical protein CB0940_00182 [Cercospora beticola]PIB01497.1 hypothetical protein CB0940_00182 [Cercospora beticola]
MGAPTAPRGQQRTFAQAASRGGSKLLQQATTRYAQSRTPNFAPSNTPATRPVNENGAADLVQGMAGLNVSNNNAATTQMNIVAPTLGPPPSYKNTILIPPGTAWAPSTSPNQSVTMQNQHHRRGWFRNEICVKSSYKKASFKVGDVISVPFHKANLIPQAQPADEVNITSVGPVYSKRRMFVVLWLADEEMFCLPLYSWNQVGMIRKQGYVKDYVSLGNWKYRDSFKPSGVHPAIWFVHRNEVSELTDTTTCHIAGGKHVEYQEDISYVGRITKSSYEALLDLWGTRNDEFTNQPTDFPPEGEQDQRWKGRQ